MNEFTFNSQFEKTVVEELHREHRHVCATHKVTLRPISIALFDSETRWGQFDNTTRTISLSRKLIKEFPWNIALGVLRHEMAHQLVAEENPNTQEQPHGELFQSACKRLGLPDQFAKSGLDLQTCKLDWRIEARDDATEKILDRVRKLLALANSTNEHEALVAMERVREIYAKNNLDSLTSAKSNSYVHQVISHGKKRIESWEQRLISLLLEHFFVTILTSREFNPASSERFSVFEIIGTKENVLMAEYVYHFLSQKVESLASVARKQGMIRGRRDANSYKLGVLEGFSRKLRNGERGPLHTTYPPPLTTVGKALVEFKNDTKLDEYIESIYPRIKSGRRTILKIGSEAYHHGEGHGKSITLNKPVSSQMGNQGRALESGRRN